MAEQTDLALIAEADDVAGCELLRRFHQRLPARTIKPLDQRGLDLRFGCAADAAAEELRSDHLGVVDDELIAGLEPGREFGDGLVVQGTFAVDHKHTRGIARTRGTQRDALGRQFKIEEIGAHAASASGAVDSTLATRLSVASQSECQERTISSQNCVWRSDAGVHEAKSGRRAG